MALPYPNMDFTALDVLHAADLDKIVANIEWLSPKPIAQADFAIENTGFAIAGCDVYQAGNVVFGWVAIRKTSGTFGSVQVVPISIKAPYKPLVTYQSFGGFGASQYFPTDTGRFAIGSNGNVFIRDQGSGGTSVYCYGTFCYVV